MTADSEPLVYLVDDDDAVLRAVSRLLRAAGFETASFESPERFLSEHDPCRPGCVVLDLQMPGVSGMELQRALAGPPGSTESSRPVIFLSGQADVPASVDAMKRGAVDFLTKPVRAEALIDAVRRALARDLERRREGASRADVLLRAAALTPREREVMALVVRGMPNKQVAAELGAAEKTIKVHRARVMEKMGAASLADLVRLADLAVEESPYRTKVQ